MNDDKKRLLIDAAKATVMLMIVCVVILLSVSILIDNNVFTLKRVIALMAFVEAVNALRSVA